MSESPVPQWLETELSRRLRRVAAPEALWDRIQQGYHPATEQAMPWFRWPIAAVLTLTVLTGMFWLGSARPVTTAFEAGDWEESCAPPVSHSIHWRVSAGRMHTLAVAAWEPRAGQAECRRCHETVAN